MYTLERNVELTAKHIEIYELDSETVNGETVTFDDETGDIINLGDKVVIMVDNAKPYCLTPDNFEEYYAFCAECGRLYYAPDGEIVDDSQICDTCFDRYYRRCEGCGELHHVNDMVWISGTYDDWVCNNWQCMERAGVEICSDCGDCYHTDSLTWIDDGCYCEDCAPNNSGILDYNEKPDPEFYGEHSHLHMGVELEIDGSCDVSDFVSEAATPEIYFKEDGSLTAGESVEIVSHPCTLDYHKGLWDKVIKTAKDYGFTSHDAGTCGLHVHIDREYLGEFDTERDYTTACIVMLFDKFWGQLVRFSRRTEGQLERWCERTGLELTKADMSAPEKVADKLQDKANNEGRYKAVNLQNSHTVEFRLFRGTLRRETFYATLELCQVIVDWCKTHRIPELATLTWGELIKSQPTEYLVDYCNLRGIDPEALGGEIKSLKVRTLQEGWDITDLKEGDLVKISETARENSISIEEVGKWCVVIASYDNEVRATTLQGGVTWWLLPGDIDRIVRVPGNEVAA